MVAPSSPLCWKSGAKADEFWDASALVPLLIDKPSTRTVQAFSAVARLERQGALVAFAIDRAFERLRGLPREVAQRFLSVHPLRTADALQLAVAYVGSDRSPTSLEFVTLDERLADAARKEGFSVVEIAVE
jgi:predicted nucleic acid-binding protein